jgi:ATP-dependent DNA ligase
MRPVHPLGSASAGWPRVSGREKDGILLNRHFAGDDAIVFKHAYELGCEGVVSKLLGSTYRSGRINDWP